MNDVHGQHEGRAQRVRETAGWLNATPVTPSGDVLVLDEEPDIGVIAAHGEAIKLALRSGCSSVVVTEEHPATREALQFALRSGLHAEDFRRIVFDPECL